MHVFMCVCVCVCIQVQTHEGVFVYIQTCEQLHTLIGVYARKYVYMSKRMHAFWQEAKLIVHEQTQCKCFL